MKHLFLLAFVFANLHTQAKDPKEKNISPRYDPIVQSILEKQITSNATQRTTAIKHRIVAKTYKFLNTNTLADTCHYYYSSTRGSNFANCEANLMLSGYEVLTYAKPDSFFDFNVSNQEMVFNQSFKYDATDRVTEFYDGIGNVVLPTRYKNLYKYYYDNNGNKIRMDRYDTLSTTTLTLKTQTYYSYDNQNRLIYDSSYQVGGTNQPTNKNVYHYNANNQQDTVRSYRWNAGWQVTNYKDYYYDANGNLKIHNNNNYDLNTSIWDYNNTNYTYDANNRLTLSVHRFQFSNMVFHRATIDTFGYQGSYPLRAYESETTWDLDTQTPVTFGATIGHHLNTQGNWDTIYYYNNISITDIVEKDYIIYNTDNLAESINGFLFNTQTNTFSTQPYDESRYYYEEYNTTEVAQIAANTTLLKIYPNPFSGSITIKQQANTPQTITITDIAGRLVKMFNTDTQESKVDLSYLPLGVYLCKAGNEVYKIVKE